MSEEKTLDTTTPKIAEKAIPKESANKIVDYISGKPVNAGPEEVHAVQPFARMLVEDYGYPVENIQTRPQWRIKGSPSDSSKSASVDIAVFSGPDRDPDDLYIIVEAKKPDERPEETQDKQIFNYLNLSSAEIGVWTNGEERLFWHKIVENGKLKYAELPTLPRYGESVSEIGLYRRHQLVVPKHLQQIFRAIRAHLAGNARGTTRDEVIAQQMIHLIFCKIYDERFTSPEDILEFRAGVDDSAEAVLSRIASIFSRVKSKYAEVFDDNDRLTLDAQSVKHVVGELQRFCLTEAGRDAVGEAFEVFIGGTLKGEQGQFFTPRNVIQLMVLIVDPTGEDQVIDPACGAGGFLIESLKHKWSNIDRLGEANRWSRSAVQEEKTASAIKTIKGIDKDEFLVKVAKAYMAIMGDGKGSIFVEDSLDAPASWEKASGAVHLGSFDVVLANPPFGKDIKVRGAAKLKQYDLAYKWAKKKGGSSSVVRSNELRKEVNPQVLFVERCLQLAKNGAHVGIILPETYFHAPSTAPVREVLLRRNNVKALIDLPHNTFRPFNNAKCIAVIVEKGAPQQDDILAVVAEEMGHNHQGKPVYRYDEIAGLISDEIWDDIAEATEALRQGADSKYVFSIDSASAINEDIWVPRYFWSAFNEDVEESVDSGVEWVTLGSLIDQGVIDDSSGHGSPPSEEKGLGDFTYARVKDIVNWEIYRDPTSGVTKDVVDQFTEKNPLLEGDVLYVARGSYRIGDVAVVGPDDTETILTREIRRFRVSDGNELGLTSSYLLYLLSTEAVRRQTKGRVFMDTTLPTIADRYRSIKLPWAQSREERERVSAKVDVILKARWESMAEIRRLLAES